MRREGAIHDEAVANADGPLGVTGDAGQLVPQKDDRSIHKHWSKSVGFLPIGRAVAIF